MRQLTLRATAGYFIEGLVGLRTIRGHTFVHRAICRESTVLDFGCNVGHFSRDIQRAYGCSPIAIEANPMLANALRREGLCVHNVAICDHDGQIEFMVSGNSEASSILSSIASSGGIVTRLLVAASTLRTFITDNKLKAIALMKLDIEGAELSVIEQMTNEDVLPQQIAVEFHDFMDPSQAPRVQSCIRQLKSLGYVYVNSTLPSHTDCLFVHKSMFKGLAGAWTRTQLRLLTTFFRYRAVVKEWRDKSR